MSLASIKGREEGEGSSLKSSSIGVNALPFSFARFSRYESQYFLQIYQSYFLSPQQLLLIIPLALLHNHMNEYRYH
jgi:hypothetical protein